MNGGEACKQAALTLLRAHYPDRTEIRTRKQRYGIRYEVRLPPQPNLLRFDVLKRKLRDALLPADVSITSAGTIVVCLRYENNLPIRYRSKLLGRIGMSFNDRGQHVGWWVKTTDGASWDMNEPRDEAIQSLYRHHGVRPGEARTQT